MKLWKNFTFQFGESVTKFYVVKVLSIFDEIFKDCGQISLNFSGGNEKKKLLQSIFQEEEKNWKKAIFRPPLHKSKLIFHVLWSGHHNFFYEFTNLNSSIIAMTM